MREEAIEIVEGADDIGVGITCAISPRSRWTRVELRPRPFLFFTAEYFAN